MSNVTNKIFTDKMGGRKATEYIGIPGELFYDPNTGVIKLSDGSTIGGKGIAESSALESLFVGDWVYFVRPDNQPEVVDIIAPNLRIARNPEYENGLIYNADEDSDGSVSTPYGTLWNTDGWQDLSDVNTRFYTNLNNTFNSGWEVLKHEYIMQDTMNNKYYAIKFLSWDSGTNNATGAFSYIRREINANVFFVREDYDNENDAFAYSDQISDGVWLTRGNGAALFNVAPDPEDSMNPLETGYNDESPLNTLWNQEGFDDLSNLTSRQFVLFPDLFADNAVGQRIVGKDLIMLDQTTGKYYAITITRWSQGGAPWAGGSYDYPGFSYTRREINTDKLTAGLKFNDGTVQHTAYSEKIAGIIKKVPQNTSQVPQRFLSPSDIGKMIYLDGNNTSDTIYIRDAGAAEFPIGSTITIVNRTGNNVYVNKINDNESGNIYGAGTDYNATSWIIPDSGGGNIAVLIKISTGMDGYYNDWMLSGSNIQTN